MAIDIIDVRNSEFLKQIHLKSNFQFNSFDIVKK